MTAANPLEALRDLMAENIYTHVLWNKEVALSAANASIQAIAEHMGGSYTIVRDDELPTQLEAVLDTGDGIEDGISRLDLIRVLHDTVPEHGDRSFTYRGLHVEASTSWDGVTIRFPEDYRSASFSAVAGDMAHALVMQRSIDLLVDAILAETTTEGNNS